MVSVHADHSKTAGLQKGPVSLVRPHHSRLLWYTQVQTSTWPVGVNSLQAAIWLPVRALQASTVVAAVCSNLVTKASQSITQLYFFCFMNVWQWRNLVVPDLLFIAVLLAVLRFNKPTLGILAL